MTDTIPDRIDSAGEYLTFGRRHWRLVRVWALQLVIVFSEIRVFGVVHPWIVGYVRRSWVLALYVLVAVTSVAILSRIVRQMGRLTFAPWSRDPRHLAVSAFAYLLFAGVAIAVVWILPAPGLTGTADGVIGAVEVALGAMATGVLADLLALGYCAQFDATDFPSQEEIDEAVEDWLESMDWVEKNAGSWEKEERYREFERRTDRLNAVLENAVTEEGKRLRDDFREWRAWFEDHDRLSQEAVIDETVDNRRLDRGRDRLTDIRDRLETLNDRS